MPVRDMLCMWELYHCMSLSGQSVVGVTHTEYLKKKTKKNSFPSTLPANKELFLLSEIL